MKTNLTRLCLAMLIGMTQACLAAATPLSMKVIGGGYDPNGRASFTGTLYKAGQTLTISLTVPVKVSKPIKWPHVEGLTDNGSGFNPHPHSIDFNYFVTPTHPGVFTIGPFDIRADDGQTFHVGAISLHVIK